MIGIPQLVQRMVQHQVQARYAEQQRLMEVLAGEYQPTPGTVLPPWKEGSSRYQAYQRALRKVQSEGPRVLAERIASAYGSLSWVNADTGEEDRRIDEALSAVNLRALGRNALQDYISHGVAAMLAYTDDQGTPRLDRLGGMIEPYTDPSNVNRITGLFRTMQFLNAAGQVRWRTEVYDFEDVPEDQAVHRYWTSIEKPTALGYTPDQEFVGPRPAFVMDRVTEDGLPVGQLETALPLMLGVYAIELQLSTAEEVSAYPVLKVKGSSDRIKQIGPAEIVGVDKDGDAEWMSPGNLGELRSRRMDRREALREGSFLYAGSLGTETPSGEALIQANRVPQQMDSDAADGAGDLLATAASSYLTLLGLPDVIVTLQPDQAFERRQRWDALKMADDMGAIPFSVKARAVQELLGGTYSDDELREFIEANQRPTLRLQPGEPA